MKKIIFLLVATFVLAVCGKAEAQTFASGSTVAKSAKTAPKQNNSSFKAPAKAPAKDKTNKAVPSKKQNTKAQPVQDSNNNEDVDDDGERKVILSLDGSEKTQKKYDNSQRKVISFKVVNGEFIYDDDETRSILVFYDNFQMHKGLDDIVRCTVRVYVLNDLKTKISNFGVKLHWKDMVAGIQMSQVEPGVKTYKDIMLLGDGCFSMDKVPTIEVNRCRVKGMKETDCASAVKWYQSKK